MHKIFYYLIFCFLLLCFNSYAQQGIDCEEITKDIDQGSSIDEKLEKIRIQLNQVKDLDCQFLLWRRKANIFENKNLIDSASYALTKASQIAQNIGNDDLYLEVMLLNVYYHTRANNKKQALKTLIESREKLDLNKESKHWVTYYNRFAYVKDGERDYKNAVRYIDSAIQIGEKFKHIEPLQKAYLEKVSYHIRLSQYQEAITSVQKGILLIEKLESQKQLGFAYFLKGICYERLRDFEKAAEALESSIAVATKYNDLGRLARSYSRLSISLGHLKKNERALEVLDSTIAISNRIGDYSTLALGYSDKGFILINGLKDYEAAEKYFLNSNNIFETKEVSQRTKDITYVSNLGGLVMLCEKRKDYPSMLKYLKQYEIEANKLNLLVHKKTLAMFYVEYNEGVGDYRKALAYHKEVTKISDSITNKEVRVDVADLEKKYESQKKEIEILKLNEESQKQKNKTQKAETKQYVYSGIALFSVLLLLLGFWAFMKTRKQQKALRSAHERLKESHEEVASVNKVKNTLFSVISHDMRNMLVPFQRGGKILKHHIDKGDYDKVSELSHKLQENSLNLSHLLDNLLNWSLEQMNGYSLRQDTIPILEELEGIKSVFLPYAEEKKTIINLLGSSDMTTIFDKGTFHIIFRNLIGNALKYTEEGTISISFYQRDDSIRYEISDTGIGMSSEQLESLFKLKNNSNLGTKGEKGTGIGLNLVYRFVEMNGGKIQGSSELRIGTKFEISFPKKMMIDKSIPNTTIISV